MPPPAPLAPSAETSLASAAVTMSGAPARARAGRRREHGGSKRRVVAPLLVTAADERPKSVLMTCSLNSGRRNTLSTRIGTTQQLSLASGATSADMLIKCRWKSALAFREQQQPTSSGATTSSESQQSRSLERPARAFAVRRAARRRA